MHKERRKTCRNTPMISLAALSALNLFQASNYNLVHVPMQLTNNLFPRYIRSSLFFCPINAASAHLWCTWSHQRHFLRETIPIEMLFLHLHSNTTAIGGNCNLALRLLFAHLPKVLRSVNILFARICIPPI